MRRTIGVIVVFFSLLLFLPADVGAVNVSSCSTLSSAGVYEVNASLSINGATCISLSSSDILLDCKGFSITGNLTSDTYGVVIPANSYSNITVRNCTVSLFGNGIGVGYTTNSNVSYNTIANISSSGASGIAFGNSNYTFAGFNTIRNLSVTSPFSSWGIYASIANHSTIRSNVIENFSSGNANGILVDDEANSRNNTISSNTVRNLNGSGIQSRGSNTTVSLNTITNITASQANSIEHTGANSTISSNTLSGSSTSFTIGILVDSGSGNVNVTSNTFTNYGGRLVDFRANNSLIAHNVITNILAAGGEAGGIKVGGSNLARGNTIFNNTVYNSMSSISDPAIQANGQSHNISYNNVTNHNGSGIYAGSFFPLTDSFVLWNKLVNVSSGGSSNGLSIEGAQSSNNTIAFNSVTNIARSDSSAVFLNGQSSNFSYNNATSVNATGMAFSAISSFSLGNLVRDVGGVGFARDCLQLGSSSRNNTIASSQFLNCSGYAISLSGSNNNSFYSSTFSQNFSGVGSVIQVINSSFNAFVDSLIVSNGSDLNYDLIANTASQNTFLNTTFNRSRIRWDDSASNATVQYYLDVNVYNGVTGVAEASTRVNLTNINGSASFSNILSNSAGRLTRQNVTALFINSSATTNHTPHNFTLSKGVWWNSTNVTFTGNTNATVYIASACRTIAQDATLLNNIVVNGQSCITLWANNTVLDLAGFSIRGNQTLNTAGVNASGLSNVTIRSGTVREFDDTIMLSSTTNSTVFNVTVFNSSGNGLSGDNANYTNVSYSNFSYSEDAGIRFSYLVGVTVQNNIVQDNVLGGETLGGITLVGTASSVLSSNTLLRNRNGIMLNQSFGNLVYGGSVTNSTSRGVLSARSSPNVISTLSLTGNHASSYRDFGFQDNSSLTLHDLSFNKSSSSFDNRYSNVTVNWTVWVNVTNATRSLQNATVNLTATGASVPAYSQLTNSTGFTVQNLTEYTQNGSQVYGTNETSYTPYARIVSYGGLTSNSVLNDVQSSGTLHVVLPALSSVSSSSVTSSGATVSWSSDSSSNSTVQFGESINYSSSSSSSASTLSHSITLPGLSSNTLYHYRVASCTPTGNCSFSPDNTFETLRSFGSSTSTPAPAPTVAPASSPTPEPTPETTPEPTVEPEATPSPTPEPTPEPLKEEEITIIIKKEVEEGGGGEVQFEAVKAKITQTLEVAKNKAALTGFTSTYAVAFENKGDKVLENVEVTQRLPFLDYLGPLPEDYPDVVWNPRPIRIEPGSAVVTWLFDNVQPGETAKAEVKVDEKIEKEELEDIATPRVIAKAAKPVKATAPSAATPTPSFAARIDYVALIVVGAIVLLAAGYLILRKRI